MGADWIARALTEADVLQMPEIGIELRVSEIYVDVEFGDTGEGAAEASKA